jgi:hypothetical protein
MIVGGAGVKALAAHSRLAGLPDEILVGPNGQGRAREVGLPRYEHAFDAAGDAAPYVTMPVQVRCAARGDCSPRLIAMTWALLVVPVA